MDADPFGGSGLSGGSEPSDEDGFDLDLLASSLQADTDDVRMLLRALVNRLAGVLGDRLEVERAGGRLFKKSDEIRRVSVHLGDDQLEAAIDRGNLVCTVARSSGGIRIRSTTVTVDQWLRQLLSTLRQEASSSQATRLALESLVIANRLPDGADGGDGPAAIGDAAVNEEGAR